MFKRLLIGLVGLIMPLLLVFGGLLTHQALRRIRTAHEVINENVAAFVSRQLTLEERKSESYARLVGTAPDILEALEEASAQGDRSLLVRRTLRLFESLDVDRIDILDASGALLMSTRNPEVYGIDRAGSPLVQQALRGDIVTGIEEAELGYSLVTAGPFVRAEEVAGVVRIERYLDTLFCLKIKDLTGSDLAIFRGGAVVASSLDDPAPLAGALQALMADQRPGETAALIATPLQRFFARVAPLAPAPAPADAPAMAVLTDSRPYEQARRFSVLLIGGGMITALAGIILACLWLSHRTVAPITALTRTAQAIAEGDFSQRAPAGFPDEVGALGSAFNRMLDHVDGYARRLEASNKELDDFTYVVSHQLKEPLRSINAFSKFLEEELQAGMTDDGRAYLSRIRTNASQLQGLIDNLLQLARVSKRPNRLELTPVKELIDDVKSRLAYQLREKRVYVAVDEALPTVLCDRLRLTEVFANLISNAVKHSDKRACRIEIGWRRRPDGDHEFTVRDNGPGIDPQRFERIFEVFRSADAGEDPGSGGVGLAIVKKVIERHQGRVWVESSVGQGATFHFTLPGEARMAAGEPA
jgi:signal transduction histidine kinase